MSTQDEVQGASAKFYAALNGMVDGDATRLADIWSHSGNVTTMHPIGGRQVGWQDVEASFAQVAGLASGGHVELKDQTIEVGGELAYELGVESGQARLAGESVLIEQRVTNVYRREAGQWKIVHHHADISPAMLALLERLQAA
jgi:ketosteroid isomerase-like protein